MRLAILSDPHCGEPKGFISRWRGGHDERNGQRFFEVMRGLQAISEPFRVVVLGDLTDRSTPVEFGEVFRAVDAYHGEVYVVPGNHDVTSPGRLGMGYSAAGHSRMRDVARHINGREGFPLVVDGEGYRLILLDSSAHDESGTLFARGRIGTRQLAELTALLMDEIPTVVAMHHYPERINPTLEVEDAGALMQVCARPHVTIINGHRHREGEYQRNEKRPAILTHGKVTETGRVRLLDVVTGEWEWVIL